MTDDIIVIEPDEIEPEKIAPEQSIDIVISEVDLQRAAATFAEQWDENRIVIEAADLDNPTTNERFYDKLRRDIQAWIKNQGMHNKYTEYILLAPDFFILLVRLIADDRVPIRLRTMLIAAAAYFISPIDAMPEAVLGPVGYLDDIVFTALGIFVVLNHLDVAVIREHWSGEGDIIKLLHKVVNMGETLVGSGLWGKFKKRSGYDSPALLDTGD